MSRDFSDEEMVRDWPLTPREEYLLANRTLLPGPSVLERLIIHVCGEVHTQLFASIYQRLSSALRQATDQLLIVPEGEQRTYFYQLKEYPPAATLSSLRAYLQRYRTVAETACNAYTPARIDNFVNYMAVFCVFLRGIARIACKRE